MIDVVKTRPHFLGNADGFSFAKLRVDNCKHLWYYMVTNVNTMMGV